LPHLVSRGFGTGFKVSEISLSGGNAVISEGYEWDFLQNKNFSGFGPFVTYPQYSDGMAWHGRATSPTTR